MRDAPAVGKRVHQEETSAGFSVGVWMLDMGKPVSAGVGDLDAEGVADDVKGEPEVSSRYSAVVRRVGRKFANEVRRRIQGEPPGAELFSGELPGETRAAGCR